ncbi:hypothetical protein ACFXAF_35395 [Kitasatospora sp. NPDC059463]|uniref:hypothetical protein n=1 Tax=unclassified Kitasatospora TaxID=2633591 RepID=UPI0036D0D52F
MAYQYTVVTPHGDVHLDTDRHHSTFDTIEDFLEHHKQTVAAAVSIGTLAAHGLGLYLEHFRGGARLR